MNINEIKKLNIGDVLENVNLKDYTTYKLNAIGRILVIPSDLSSLIKLLRFIKSNNLKYKVLGFGSDVIFVNPVYDGIIIKLDNFNNILIDKNIVTVGAGYSLIKLSLETARHGLSGLEFASGIPGSVGGALFMNAGAYKSDMGYIVVSAKVLTPNYEVVELSNKELDFHYRSSFLQKNKGYICLEVKIKLNNGNRDDILEVIRDRKKRRLETQPIDKPSAGSVFRNPSDNFAGKLIEDIGLKGKKIGGAMVSEKHANFIINVDNATGQDIKNLIELLKKEVKEKYNIDLFVEQEFID